MAGETRNKSRRTHFRRPHLEYSSRVMIHVEESRVPANDEAALGALLVRVPHPPSVRKLLRKHFFGRRWNRVTGCDYWLASNGQTVVCVTICGAAPDVIANLRSRFDAIRDRQLPFVLSHDAVRDLLKTVVGEDQLRA